VAPGYEVPGWFFLRARRHAEKLTGLDEAETATFGRHAHDLVSAVEQVTGAPAVRDVPAASTQVSADHGGHTFNRREPR
jgi:diadenosine tetraphosphate (Ap4A) HIT family hydrolase